MIERVLALKRLSTPNLVESIQVFHARYRRAVPLQYRGNPYIREEIRLNVLFVAGGTLVVPASLVSSYEGFYCELKERQPGLFRHVLSPAGTAKYASTEHVTPIKAITQLELGYRLFGDGDHYGWSFLEEEITNINFKLQVLFQGNGLYYNRGSVFFDGEKMREYPDEFLAEILAGNPSTEECFQLGMDEKLIKRPLLFFCRLADGRMAAYVHYFQEDESYFEGIKRLQVALKARGVQAALAASPALILPNGSEPEYVSLGDMMTRFQANDVRHYLYCPYEGGVLLSAELSRMQGLEPEALAHSLSGKVKDRVCLRLQESLNIVRVENLGPVLDRKGYGGRYHFSRTEDGQTLLHINLLEGVYSHLVIFLTQKGRLGLIQTSGTRGNVTGNDGPTYRQLVEILQDLNQQRLFVDDRIIAAASGSQGNDVPNVLCRGSDGKPHLLHDVAPDARLDEHVSARGIVTTPRVGIALGV